jgi:hypothetical protein
MGWSPLFALEVGELRRQGSARHITVRGYWNGGGLSAVRAVHSTAHLTANTDMVRLRTATLPRLPARHGTELNTEWYGLYTVRHKYGGANCLQLFRKWFKIHS